MLWVMVGMVIGASVANAQSLRSLLKHAPTTTPPLSKFAPKKNLHPFASQSAGASPIRRGTVQLSTGTILHGSIWTTQQTPFRVWLKNLKQYRDIDIRLVREIIGKIRYARRVRQYKFQQMGSNIKLYSGRTRPRIGYQFTFKLMDGKVISGTVIAPIYLRTRSGKQYFYLLKKRIDGKLGQKTSAIVYIKRIRFSVTVVYRKYASEVTRRLPLIHWRRLLTSADKH